MTAPARSDRSLLDGHRLAVDPALGRRLGVALERVYVVVTLLALTLGPVYQVRIRWGGALGVDFIDDGFVHAVFSLLYTVAVALLARRWRPVGERRGVLAATAAFGVVVAASTLWSTDRVRTLSQAVLLAGTMAFAWYVATAYRVRDQIALLWAAMQIGVLWSAWAIWRGWPGTRDVEGHWTGIYFNRNSLGPVCALSLVATAALAVRMVRGRRGLGWLVPLGAAGLLALRLLAGSRSLTPTAGLALAGLTAATWSVLRWLVARRRLPARLAAPVFWVALATGALAVLGVRSLALQEAGKTSTLATRTVIWAQVVDGIREHPVRGRGWLSAWTSERFRAALAARYVKREQVPPSIGSAHNGYLEVTLGTGVLGAATLGVLLVALARRAGRYALGDGEAPSWPVALLVYGLAVNTQESFIGANLLVWVIVIAAGAVVGARPMAPR